MNPLNAELLEALLPPILTTTATHVEEFRTVIANILKGEDDRLLIVAGPCSLHDKELSLEYARRLQKLSTQVEDRILLVMRAFVEKPRSKLGWKGLMHDPHLNNTHKLNEGLTFCRSLLEELSQFSLPLATEFLEPLTSSYLIDLISLGFIGARTSASQIHRQLASSLPCPIGFKNCVTGDIGVAVHGVLSARSPHYFVTIDEKARAVQARSHGNPDSFIVLRGSETSSNYHPKDFQQALKLLEEEGLPQTLVVDCAHGNSRKNDREQMTVFRKVLELRKEWPIVGMMLESHLKPGKELSLTDSCLGWEETEALILEAYTHKELLL